MRKNRLTPEESRAVVPGSLLVWEERPSGEYVHGIGRFCDGKPWSKSCWRKGPFVVYGERTSKGKKPSPPSDRLFKQTLRVLVDTGKGYRYWRMNAYYSEGSQKTLMTVKEDPFLSQVLIDWSLFPEMCSSSRRNMLGDPAKEGRIEQLCWWAAGALLSKMWQKASAS
ncbi:hypothetical protein CVT26_014754 [Gymnopilus dilepis]|uniref:Uncharacterized protein n=1 Tax=Gymnopilus dilepis TaxID=231916 RepID=A0A409WR08_9AGAR|nr:hypothetical protein CVT26_014754 [Gymnopilus dilepis]